MYANYNFEDEECLHLRPAKVLYCIQHYVVIDPPGPSQPCIFAVVYWHPAQTKIGKPVEIWCKNLYENDINKRFLPVNRIHSRLAIAYDTISLEEVLVTIPLIED